MNTARALCALMLSPRPQTARFTLAVDGVPPAALVRALMEALPGTLPSAAQAIARSRPVEVEVGGVEVRGVIAALERHGIEAEVTLS